MPAPRKYPPELRERAIRLMQEARAQGPDLSLVMRVALQLVEPFGIGADTAAEILIVAGDNPERIRSEAAFAKLAGISPVPTGSGITSGRHRISHGGHRQLNAAIYRTVIVRHVTPRTYDRLRCAPNG